MLALIVDLDKIRTQEPDSVNIIVTTRPDLVVVQEAKNKYQKPAENETYEISMGKQEEANKKGSNPAEGRENVVAITGPEPAAVNILRSHWKESRYQEFAPSELRGDASKATVSPLLKTLMELIQRKNPNLSVTDLNVAYGLLFDGGVLKQFDTVLAVLLASYEPRSFSDLHAMGLLEMARELPGYGDLFQERDSKLHLLHRSIAEW
eukprot:gene61459-biopygen3011